MYYSLVGVLALIILIISNHDIFFNFKEKRTNVVKIYRNFLFAVALFYISDILWGIFEKLKFRTVLFIDTIVFFVAMAFGIVYLTQYVVAYMDRKGVFGKILIILGKAFICVVSVVMVVNIFYPIMFSIDENCNYVVGYVRYITLGVQIIILFFTSIYAFYWAYKTKQILGKRYFTIGLLSTTMLIAISIQMYFPLYPLYSIGYMVGCSLLRVFTINNEKEEYRLNLEKALLREKLQSQELKEARALAYTDALTGTKNKLAFLEKEESINNLISDGTLSNFAIIVFDINNLKMINDTLGHHEGDDYIKKSCDLINNHFSNSTLFRIGGDEFIVVLEGTDFENRNELLDSFNKTMENNAQSGNIVISTGMSEYNDEQDLNFKMIMDKADSLMYKQKEYLKKIQRTKV